MAALGCAGALISPRLSLALSCLLRSTGCERAVRACRVLASFFWDLFSVMWLFPGFTGEKLSATK